MRIGHDSPFAACLVVAWSVVAPLSFGQQTGQLPPADGSASPFQQEISADAIAKAIEQIEKAAALDEATRSNLKNLYERAQADLEQAATALATAKEHDKLTGMAPADLARLRRNLEEPLPPLNLEAVKEQGLPELIDRLADLERQLELARKEFSAAEVEPQRRTVRRGEIPTALSEVRRQFEDVRSQLAMESPAEESPMVREAHLVSLRAREAALAAQATLLESEMRLYESQTEIPRLERDRLARLVGHLEEDIKALRRLVDERRKRDAASQREQAQSDLESAPPELKPIAQESLDYAQRRLELTEKINSLAVYVGGVESQLADWSDDFALTRKRVSGRMSTSLGLYLRKKHASLPSIAPHLARLSEHRSEFRHIQTSLFDLEDARSSLSHADRHVGANVALGSAALPEAEVSQRKEQVQRLLANKARVLGDLLDDTNRYFDLLIRAAITEEDLIQEVQDYQAFLNQHMFWIGSALPPSLQDVENVGQAVAWLVRPENWTDLRRATLEKLQFRPIATALASMLLCLYLLFRGRTVARVIDLGNVARRGSCRTFTPTLHVLGLSLLHALPWPFLTWFTGWRLSDAPAEFPLAFSLALRELSFPLLVVLLARQIFLPGGLAEAHFGWPRPVQILAGRSIGRILLFGLPFLFFAELFHAQESEQHHVSLGRLCFVVAMGVFALEVSRLFGRKRGIPSVLRRQDASQWMTRLYPLWYLALTATPLALAVLAVAGYYHTSWVLASKVLHTVFLVSGLLLLGAVLYRWVRIKRRQLALQKQQLEREVAGEDEAEGSVDSLAAFEAEEPETDLDSIDQQTRQLIRALLFFAGLVGAWLIWIDILPAMSPLRDTGLWRATRPDGSLAWITLADVLFALAVFLTTIAAARNVPGLVEILLLERLPLESSLRYAFTRLSQYAIVVVGILVTSTSLGLTWSKVQWLVAALGVGIGFGLQEVVANFICGIILLFERPIRIGDIVTLGDTTGVVTRIQIRATTIRNWDRKELVVPNKDLITGRILNWSLTDQMNRVVIPVGIAYGSDTRRAREILYEILQAHPNVLEAPAALVTFDEFSESSLNFTIRAFLEDLDGRLETIHDLHTAIHDQFRESGIEIAFPQRDLHIRTLPPGPIPATPATAGGPSPGGESADT